MAHTPPGQTREKVYRFVRDRLLSGSPPTVREVQAAMGFAAVESARKQLEALVREGRLAKSPGRSRGYHLPATKSAASAMRIPVLGTIQAGDLQAAVEDPDGWIVVESRRSAKDLFALRVRGDSMCDAGILEDDLVVVRRQPTAEKGDIVVALVEDEATVKRWRTRRNRAVLEPANEAFEPIVLPLDQVEILGRVIEVRRSLD